MGLFNSFEETEDNNHSLLTEVLDGGLNETSNEKMMSKPQGRKFYIISIIAISKST